MSFSVHHDMYARPICHRIGRKYFETFFYFRVHIETCSHPDGFHGIHPDSMPVGTTLWASTFVGRWCSWYSDHSVPSCAHLYQPIPNLKLRQVARIHLPPRTRLSHSWQYRHFRSTDNQGVTMVLMQALFQEKSKISSFLLVSDDQNSAIHI